MKICSKCGVKHDRNASYCKECHAAYYRQYRNRDIEATRARERERWFKKTYGLSKSDYQILISGGCAICGSNDNLQVDHNHYCCPGRKSCGKCVRGALCARHNILLGRVNDDVEELQKMIDYLLAT